MKIPNYQYPISECDVPKVRQAALGEYRIFRKRCLEYMRGNAATSVMNQVQDLAWKTAVFRTLNEARRIEPYRMINGAMWELIVDGYVCLMALGVRKLVDRHSATDSVWNVLASVEKRPELLTRENFVCYDGLPFDYQQIHTDHINGLDLGAGHSVNRIPTQGPKAWGTSRMLHLAFDKLAGTSDTSKRKKTDSIQNGLLLKLKGMLAHPAIEKVCAMADKVFAHAERVEESGSGQAVATFDDVDEALKQIVRVANFLSSSFFYDTTFVSVVATPQFNVFDGLDESWIQTENLPVLSRYWDDLCSRMNNWGSAAEVDLFAIPNPP